jgi:hypothetical protein
VAVIQALQFVSVFDMGTVHVSTDQHVYVCRSLQINITKYDVISSNPNNISRYFPLIGDEIVEGEGLNYPGSFFFLFFF